MLKLVDYFCQKHLVGYEEHFTSDIAFSKENELLVSYYNDGVYMFTDEMSFGLDT